MPIYFVAGIFSINLLEKARPRFILTAFATLNYSAVIFYSYLYPEKIVPVESHEELLKNDEIYQEIYDSQLKGVDL